MTEQRTSPENSNLRVDVTLKSAIVRVGEGATVVMTEALALDIRLPSGNSLLVRYPSLIPGEKPRVMNARLQPGIKQKFEIYLGKTAPHIQPSFGKCSILRSAQS
ncbi:MAG: hypothetical protein J2P21_30115 [Chloracidobacterium sp.]|nr:hypothetical protein [Chloracidobacterium sp.]